MAGNEKHHLADFFATAQKEMQDDYIAIRKQHADDTGIAGDVAENNWRVLFSRWLPNNLRYATKVRILGVEGELSNEVDLVILDPAYPMPLLEKKQIISTGVVAAFECKLTLRASDFKKTFQKTKQAKNISGGFFHPQSLVSEHYVNLHGGFPYGVLAHSHEWKEDNSTPYENIERNFWDKQFPIAKCPRDTIDHICVADTAFFNIATMCIPPHAAQHNAVVSTVAFGTSENPIANLLSRLMMSLARKGFASRAIANYVAIAMALKGSGKSRPWPNDAVPDGILQGLENGSIDYRTLMA